MAAFETLAGVTKIRRGLYEVNAVVDIGAGIDNMIDSVIRIKAGQLRWRAGCTTTFTRCTFIEQDLADRYGVQNWYVGTSRFEGAGCSPIFKGCEWIIEREIGANPQNATDAALYATAGQSPGAGSGFDVGVNASPQFLFDENGQPTRLTIYNDGTDGSEAGTGSWTTANFIAGPSTIVNGFIVDIKGRADGAMTFGVNHPIVTSMKLKDNSVLYVNDVHMSAPMLNWPASNWVQTISGLSARNIGVGGSTGMVSYNNPNSYVRLLNPVGEIAKPNLGINTYHNYGKLVIERTAKFQFLDASGNTIDKVRVITENRTTNAIKADTYSTIASGYSIDLRHWAQDFNSVTKTYDNLYRFYIKAYGYTPQVKTLDVGTTTDPYYNYTTTLLFADPYITQTNPTTVSAYTSLTDANMVYDAVKYYAYAKTTTVEEFGKTLVSYNNKRLDFGDLNVKLVPTLNVTSYLNNALTNTTLSWTPPASQNTLEKMLTLNENTYSTVAMSEITSGSLGDFTLSDDGLKLWVSVFGTGGAAKIYEYNLSTAHDLTTRSLAVTHALPLPNTTAVSGNWPTITTSGNAFTFTWAPDGLSFIMPVANVGWLLVGTCSTAFNLATTASATINWSGFPSTDIPQTTSAPKARFTTTTTKGSTIILQDQRTMEIAAGSQTLNRWRAGTVTYPLSASAFTNVSYMATQTNYSFQAMEFIDGSFYYVANDTPNSTAWPYGGTKGRLLRLDDGDPVDIALGNPADWKNAVLTSSSYTSSSSSTTQALYFARSVPLKFGFEHANVFKNAVTGKINVWLIDTTSKSVWTYEVPSLEIAGYYTGGDANTMYLKASNVSTTSQFTGLVTTGYFTLTGGATTGLAVQDANGVAATIEVTSIVDGSRLQMYNVTQAVELANVIVSGTSYSFAYTSGAPGALVADGDVIRVRATYCNGTTAKNQFETFLIAGEFGGGTFLNQTNDLIYQANAIDGSTITEFTADGANIQVDVLDLDGATTAQRLWAWYCYYMTTSAGIGTFFGGLLAEDILNYKVITAKANITVQNVGTNSVLLSGGRIYKDNGTPIFAAGAGPIQNEYGRAYAIEVSTSGGLATDQFNTLRSNLTSINDGIKKASKLIPYNGNLT